MTNFIKTTAKKVAKTGYFRIIHIGKTEISFTDGNTVYSCQKRPKFYLFRIGHVLTGARIAPTYESDYRHLGRVKVAQFIPVLEQHTDNPDFVLRQSLNYLLQ